MCPRTTDYFDKWATDWGTKNGLKVTVDHVPTNTVVTKASADVAIKGGHDLTQLQFPTDVHLFTENLVDVSAAATYLDKKYGGYIDAAKKIAMVNGVWKGVPDFVIPYPGIYRKDYFDAAGVTKPVDTWDDLLKAGTALKKAGHPVGLAINQGSFDSSSHLNSILYGFGGKWIEADGKTIAINSQETKDAINYVVQLYNNAMTPEVLGWDDSGNNLLLASGAGSFIMNPISAYLSSKKEIQDACLFSLPPAGPKGRFMVASGPYSWGVWNWSKQQGAAQQLIVDHMDDWLNGTKANQGYELPTLKFVAQEADAGAQRCAEVQHPARHDQRSEHGDLRLSRPAGHERRAGQQHLPCQPDVREGRQWREAGGRHQIRRRSTEDDLQVAESTRQPPRRRCGEGAVALNPCPYFCRCLCPSHCRCLCYRYCRWRVVGWAPLGQERPGPAGLGLRVQRQSEAGWSAGLPLAAGRLASARGARSGSACSRAASALVRREARSRRWRTLRSPPTRRAWEHGARSRSSGQPESRPGRATHTARRRAPGAAPAAVS